MTLTFGSYVPVVEAPACPSWCDGGDHTPSMQVEDWKCLSEYAVLTRTADQPIKFGDDRWGFPHVMVFLEQQYGTRLPVVMVYDEKDDTEIRLTETEARELIQALEHQLDLLSNSAPGIEVEHAASDGASLEDRDAGVRAHASTRSA